MTFARDVVDAADPAALAMVELTRDGRRREWSFGEVAAVSAALAARFAGLGIQQGDVVMTLIGNRPEWVVTMVACFRIGAVALPCNEQLRPADLRARLDAASPRLVVADARNRAVLDEAKPDCEVVGFEGPEWIDQLLAESTDGCAEGQPWSELPPEAPALITFTSGTTGSAKGIVHGQRYLSGQRLQAEHWLGAAPRDLVWCTAASGWSKSARNVFIAPGLRGAAALLHDGRFDPDERLELLARERVNVLCMAPTEYRVIAKRAELRRYPELRQLVAAGEALNPEVLRAWREATGLEIRDGYGQTETGQLTGNPPGEPARPGSMGKPLPGVALQIIDGELVLNDPHSDPTFFVGWLGGEPAPLDRPWHTGDLVTADADGYLHFQGRNDDLIISAGYRIGPFEVESALVSHPAVAEAAVVAAPDDERGSVVRAVVVLRNAYTGSEELVRELQEHVQAETAPYKYPRLIEFVDELPKTASGKIQRARLRDVR